MKNLARIAGALALAVTLSGLGGCTSFVAGVTSAMASFSSSTPTQVTTLADADLAADTVVNLTKAAVDTNTLSVGQLTEIQSLRGAVRKALDDLHAANTAGQGLNFSVFNAAVDAWQSYAAAQGIQN